MSDELSALLERFPAVSLAELDERAALLRRVDNKYAIERGSFLELARTLGTDHDVLEIDGRREFAYRTTYFETPDLRCFVDHVEGHIPRFKVRTRVYEDTNQCVFEVKLKRGDDETDKRQLDYEADDSERVTPAARECLDKALRAAGIEVPDELEPGLRTSFRRATLAARGGSERITCDVDVRLSSPDGRAVELRSELVLVEAKTENGDSPADRALAEIGGEPISLSKYRIGMSLLAETPGYGAQPGSQLFDLSPATTIKRRN
jgi:VTC domain